MWLSGKVCLEKGKMLEERGLTGAELGPDDRGSDGPGLGPLESVSEPSALCVCVCGWVGGGGRQ